ncbi:MAG: hypothetical protein ABI210_03410 [Abditibacteriaceae bacterium]
MFTKKTNLVGIILFVAVWVLILAIPRTRSLLYAQLLRAYSPTKDVQAFPADFTFPSDSQRPALETLAKKYPNDAMLLAVIAETSPIDRSSVNLSFSDRLPKLDALIERFPDDSWLLQYRGRQSLSGGFTNPPGSYVGNSDGERTSLEGTTNWLTPAQMQQTLRMMHLAETRDPQNSFYNWVEAKCWYGLGNSDKALDALQRGSCKTSYDDGSLQGVNARLHVQALLKLPLMEDRWRAVESQIMPQYARMREVTRVVEWQGAMQEKAGNHQRALDIYGAQMRLSTLMLHDSKMLIGRLVAQAMLAMTWQSLTRAKPSDEQTENHGTKKESGTLYIAEAQRFADYANTHGRADLGNQAFATARSIVDDPLYFPQFREGYSFMPRSTVKSLGLLKWSGMVLLEVVLTSVAVWFCLLLILALLEKTVLSKSKMQQVPLKQLGTWSCILFVLICTVVGTAILLSEISDKSNLYSLMISPRFWFSDRVTDNTEYLGYLTTWIPWASLALLLAYCILPACWKMRKCAFTLKDFRSAKWADSFLALIGKVLTLWLPLLFIEALWTIFIMAQSMVGTYPTFVQFCSFLTTPLPLFLFLVYLYRTQRRPTSPPQFSATAYWISALRMIRNSLALLIVICSVAYCATSFASLPLRNQANASLDRYVKMGEVDFLRQALEQDKAEYTDADTTE